MKHIYDVITSCQTVDQLDVCNDWITRMEEKYHWKLFFYRLIGDVHVHISEVNNGGKVIKFRKRTYFEKRDD